MVEVDQEILEKALNALNKTKELICSALQLTNAVNRGTILPGQFKKNLQVFESDSGNRFNISLDWEQRPDYFKKVVGQDIQSCIINYAIILGKESYSKIPWAQENVDLFAAQKILKFVRDAVGHIYPFATKERAVPMWRIDHKEDLRRFEIRELQIVLDTRNLNGIPFEFSHLGGVENLLKILNYLIKDLEKRRLSAIDKQQACNKIEKISERSL